jgi:Restriction endonuclease/SNF2-related domain
MPPVRKATGQAVSPLKRPSIAGVRELRFRNAAIFSFPLPPSLAVRPMEPGFALPVRVAPAQIWKLNLGRLDPPTLSPMGSNLMGPTIETPGSVQVETDSMGGGIRSGRRAPGEAAAGEATWLSRLTPLLLAPALEPEVAAALGARPYQQDAAQAFLANPRFLLADDIGTGKARAVCLALAVLTHQREVHRTLIAAPRERLAHWHDELEAFVPELLRREMAGSDEFRRSEWPGFGQVDLVAVPDLARDLEAGFDLPSFDLIVIDSFIALLRRQAVDLRRLSRLEVPRRWALAGTVPVDPEDWRTLLGFLSPDVASGPARAGTGELRERFTQHTLRRSKTELARQMPRLTRQEVWVDLDPDLDRLYRQALAIERERLRRLGGSLSRSHLQASLDSLKQVCNFTADSYDGPKVRALIDLAEEITSARSKLVVFTIFGEATASRLQPALEAFGVVRLRADASPEEQAEALARFRSQPGRRVLLADAEARGDDRSLDPCSYILHFDHDWNPAHRRRLEQRFFPDLGPAVPLTVYEVWVRGTVEEQYHRALKVRHLLASNLPQDTQPSDLDERLSFEDWRREVFETITAPSKVESKARGTGALPGTGTLRYRLDSLTPEELAAAAEAMLALLGFDSTRRLTEAGEEGLSFLACRRGGADCRLVHCLRTGKNIGVQEARAVIEEAEQREDCRGALLLVTTEFTPACKKLAEDSGGHLALLSGEDLYRHFRELGVVP